MPFDANDPDTKAAIKVITDKLTADFDTRIEAIDAKKQEALDEAKKAKAELRKTQDIKPEDVAALEADNDKLKADLVAAQKGAKDATTAAEKAAKALEAEQGFTHKLLVENGLREQLVAVGVVHPAHQKGAIAMLATQVKVAADGDDRVAKVGDKALADFVKEWAGGDEGKAFVTAPVNHGGQAPGGGKESAPVKTMLRSAFDALPTTEQHAFTVKDGGKVIDQAA